MSPVLDHYVEWWRKDRRHRRLLRPINRMRLNRALAQHGAYARGVVYGEALDMLIDGRLQLGKDAFLEPQVWLTGGETGRIIIGSGSFLNLGVMIAALDLVEIGDHCMIANGCVITDANHRFDDPTRPVTWQGFDSKGPTRIGANCWLGANVMVTSGVTIGERCVIGANSVVTGDVPPFSVVAGNPARVMRRAPA